MAQTLFHSHRTLLQAKLKEQHDLDLFVVGSFTPMQQTNDASAPFIQEAHFYYLTGIDEPGWTLLVDDTESVLIAPKISDTEAIFNGQHDFSQICNTSGVDRVVPRNEGLRLLRAAVKKYRKVGVVGPDPYRRYNSFHHNPAQKALSDMLKKMAGELVDILPIIARQRAQKNTDELTIMREAIGNTVKAFKTAHNALLSKQYEYDLEAEFGYVFRSHNAQHAYEPIVAGGSNACTLHYAKNNAALPKNGLVLIDIGARFNGYCADITRTYAIGEPSSREKAVHAAVQKAHFAIIDLIRPGVTFKDYQDGTYTIMKEALRSLGLLNTPADYRKYFPHAISHGLGIDVHESLGGYKEFQPGMVLTVEPGIYIPEEGIGVRIEDDILVTEAGNENLSAALSTDL